MFQKLRIKFIAIVMVSVAVVLGLTFTGIIVTNYRQSMSEVEIALSTSIDRASEGFSNNNMNMSPNGEMANDGLGPSSNERPLEDIPPQGSTTDGNASSYGTHNANNSSGNDFVGPRIGGMNDGESILPVAVYMVMDDNTLEIITSFTTAQIDEDVLNQASSILSEREDGIGTLSDLGLHYEKRTTVTTTYIAFADVSHTNSWQTLAITLVIAGIGILAIFFIIALQLSKWALKPVKEAWDSQRQFVADASHELKTPLTVILANNSILLKHSQDSIASQSQWIESSQVEAESMQGLVNEMLELAQVESRAAVHHELLDFSDLVDGIALQFESVAFERGCLLDEIVVEGILVNGDASRLTKAISTLIENALKYVDENGTVNVKLTDEGKNAVLAIHNSGSVIGPDDLPHIFDRFYRTNKARTSGTGGYGLGLAIAREIAREHDGDITCASSPEQGTTFTMTIPVAS